MVYLKSVRCGTTLEGVEPVFRRVLRGYGIEGLPGLVDPYSWRIRSSALGYKVTN